MKIIKRYQHFIMRAVNVCLIVGICIGYHQMATVRAEKEAKIEKENQATASNWKDGTYTGEGTGFGGKIAVKVTVTDGSIANVEITEAKSEDSAYFDQAKKLTDIIVKQQTADVDTISGATYSSKGIIEATQNALKGAS